GTIVTSSGKTVPNARVSLTDSATGAIRSATTRENGVFAFDNVSVGGPYSLEARAVGFAPASVVGMVLHLGDRLESRLVLEKNETQKLDAVLIRGSALRDAGAGGPAYSIPGEAI